MSALHAVCSSESQVVMFSTTVIIKLQEQLLSTHLSAVSCFHFSDFTFVSPSKYEAQTALFKAPVRTAL